MIDSIEGRYIANTDIPGDFIKTDYDKGDIHIKMEGATVTIIEEIDQDYYKEFIYIDIRINKCMYT